jgi:hypothetical protein
MLCTKLVSARSSFAMTFACASGDVSKLFTPTVRTSNEKADKKKNLATL